MKPITKDKRSHKKKEQPALGKFAIIQELKEAGLIKESDIKAVELMTKNPARSHKKKVPPVIEEIKPLTPLLNGDLERIKADIQNKLKKAPAADMGGVITAVPPEKPLPPEDIPPIYSDPDIEIQKNVISLIEKFQGEEYQNTHITPDERLIISLIIKNLALNRWSTSKIYANTMLTGWVVKEGGTDQESWHQHTGIGFNDSEWYVDVIVDFLRYYLGLGVPLDREGRKETAGIISAFLVGMFGKKKDKEDEKLLDG